MQCTNQTNPDEIAAQVFLIVNKGDVRDFFLQSADSVVCLHYRLSSVLSSSQSFLFYNSIIEVD